MRSIAKRARRRPKALVSRRCGRVCGPSEGVEKFRRCTASPATFLLPDLESLDATILQFDPDYQVEAIKPKAFRPSKDWSDRGRMTRIILSILRQAAEPFTTRDIALLLLVERRLDRNDQRLLRLMTKRVGVALRGQREKGAVWSEHGPGQHMLWRLAHRKIV